MVSEMTKRIYAVWPCNKEGQPNNNWRQEKRWLVLDVTKGLDHAIVVAGPISRWEALKQELELRACCPAS